jgi:hypothetical protein
MADHLKIKPNNICTGTSILLGAKKSLVGFMIIKNGFLVFSKVFSPNQQAPSPGGQRGTPIPAYGLGCSVYTPIADPHHDDWSAITNRVGFFIRNSVIEFPPPPP